MEQQKEIDALRAELGGKRTEVYQLRMRWIPMCTVIAVYLSLCILSVFVRVCLHLCACVYAFVHDLPLDNVLSFPMQYCWSGE